MTMRTIITGGTGLIGRALADSLVADKHEVIVLTRRPEQVTGLPKGVQAVGWDGLTADGWAELVEGAGAIVNLAGENIGAGRWTSERKRRIVQSRADAGRAVVQAVQTARHKPSVVIQASGIGFYGPRGDEEITERDGVGSDFQGRVCIDWEGSTAPVEDMRVRRAVIRSGVVLSTRGGALQRMLLPFKLFAGGPLGGGRQWLSWVHIADEVRGIRFLIDHPEASGPFNLCSPNPITNSQFARAAGSVLKRPSFIPTPAWAVRLVFGEMASIVLQGQRGVPRRLLEMGFTFRFADLGYALRDLLG